MNEPEFATIDLELNNFSKDELIALIVLSDDWNLPINDVIVRVITNFLSSREEQCSPTENSLID